MDEIAPPHEPDRFTLGLAQSPSEVVDWLQAHGQRVLGCHIPAVMASGVVWQSGPNELVRLAVVGDTLIEVRPGLVLVEVT